MLLSMAKKKKKLLKKNNNIKEHLNEDLQERDLAG